MPDTTMTLEAPLSTRPSRSMDLHGIYEISKILGRADGLPRLLKDTLCVLDSFLDMSLGLCVLLGEDGTPELVIGGRMNEADALVCFNALPERAIGQVVVTHIPVVVEDVARDDAFGDWDTRLWGPAGRSYTFLGVPIREADRTVGLLVIGRAWEGQPFPDPDGDVRFLKMVANLIGQTIRLHRVLARDRERMIEEQRRADKLRDPAQPPASIAGIVGRSPAIRAVIEKVRIAARRDVTVLLRGESGTGKELFAQALHNLSPRARAPFVSLNCAALPESVLESELFGHEKGAFTSALTQRKGRFELADGGTLFLDEIGEISPAFQAKLLRVLQEGSFERVGGTRTLKVDVRIVAATNRDLEEAVLRGGFRADLYYRINVVPILLPPLREREGDIPLLADAVLARFNRENATGLALDRSAYEVLSCCSFPGNVRELENCIRRTATLTGGSTMRAADFACRADGCLSSLLWKPRAARPQPSVPAEPPTAPCPPAAAGCGNAGSCGSAERGERERLLDAMEKTGWVQAAAARLLNLTPRQVGYALRKHGIEIRRL
jgi:Nif-specific regulatory protein